MVLYLDLEPSYFHNIKIGESHLANQAISLLQAAIGFEPLKSFCGNYEPKSIGSENLAVKWARRRDQ
jgi:hypothetical protein